MALTSSYRYLPFSHIPGTWCLIPGSLQSCQVFPSHACIYDASNTLLEEVRFSHEGPLKQFCVQQDLEHLQVIVSGFSSAGFVRYYIKAREPSIPRDRERLFLGVDKSQEWSQVVRRSNMLEILPFWYFLAQSVAKLEDYPPIGNAPSLFANMQQGSLSSIHDLFLAGFHHMLVPRLVDSDFLGYLVPVVDSTCKSPYVLLEHSFRSIRALFFQEEKNSIHILPNLPSECVSGSLLNVTTQKGHKVSIEFRSNMVRRLQIVAAQDDELAVVFQKQVKSFRIGKGRHFCPQTLKIRAKNVYLLDNFQK